MFIHLLLKSEMAIHKVEYKDRFLGCGIIMVISVYFIDVKCRQVEGVSYLPEARIELVRLLETSLCGFGK